MATKKFTLDFKSACKYSCVQDEFSCSETSYKIRYLADIIEDTMELRYYRVTKKYEKSLLFCS